jgi:hypothetical protein
MSKLVPKAFVFFTFGLFIATFLGEYPALDIGRFAGHFNSGISATFNDVSGRQPQSESENHQQRIGDFHSPPEYRPVLGSILTSIASLAAASMIFRRFRVISILLAFQATIGLLLGFDFWNLGIWIWS